LEHLRETVDDLPAIVGRAFCPSWASLGGSLDGVAQVLARALRDVGEKSAALIMYRIHAGGLAADEGTADVALGGFGDGKRCHARSIPGRTRFGKEAPFHQGMLICGGARIISC